VHILNLENSPETGYPNGVITGAWCPCAAIRAIGTHVLQRGYPCIVTIGDMLLEGNKEWISRSDRGEPTLI
jgi:hypothetical protein